MKRDSVVIYRNFYEGLKGVSERSYKRIMNAVLSYALDGIEPKLSGLEYAVFSQAKTQIDANNRKFENGKQGGRPRNQSEENENQTETTEEPNHNQTITKEKPNETKPEPSHANEKCKMRNVILKVSKKESKERDLKNNNNACALESYGDIMDEWGCSPPVKLALGRFIQHCRLNGQTLTNDRLNGIIRELDLVQGLDDDEQVRAIDTAINGGYFDIRRSG